MGLADLFRPKWKHSDAEVRASAVRQLSEGDAQILATVARTDTDAAVRRIAIKKLADVAVLADIARSDSDESLRTIAAEKQTSLLLTTALVEKDEQACAAAVAQLADSKALAEVAKNVPHDSVRRAAVARISDARWLSDVARNASEPTVRLEALRSVSDAAVLRGIAQTETNKEVALAAVERIEDVEGLEAVAKRGKVKAARARAQKKLDQLKGTKEPSAQGLQQARLHQLCRTVETLAASSEWERAAQQIEAAQGEWREIAEAADAELHGRFERACALFFDRRARYRAQRQEQRAQAQALQAQQAQTAAEERHEASPHEALCELCEALAGDDVVAKLDEARARWQSLGPVPESQRALDGRFRRALEAQEQRLAADRAGVAARQRFEELLAEAERLVETPGGQVRRRLRELQAEARPLASAAPEELRQRLQSVVERLEQREQEANVRREQRKQENLTRFEALCKKLEGLVSSDNLKVVERQLKEAQGIARRLTPLPTREQEDTLRRRLGAARDQLSARARELRDADGWKRWSNVPKQEELCARVEALLAAPDLKETAQKLRQAQAEWKQVGPVPKDKSEALWTRFKGACDGVYARCQEYFTQLEGERAENLKKKETLCEQVEALVDSTDWNTTADTIKGLQAEWKKVGPVPKDKSDAVWKRFRAACDKFFDQRQDHLEQLSGERSENLTKKEALCERVEALVDATDFEATAEQIKALQGDWKRIGPVPRAKSDAVWRRFRAACDKFFDRRQTQIDGERGVNLTKKEELCLRLEALIPASGGAPPGDATQVAALLATARTEWREIGPVPRDRADTIWERFSGACERIVELYPEAFRGTDLDPTANLKKKERLCEQAEALLSKVIEQQAAAAPAETVEQMAERLRSALAANAFSAAFAEAAHAELDPRELSARAKDLQVEWKKIGPVPGGAGQQVWERFRAACDTLLGPQRHEERGEEKRGEEERGGNLTRKQEICSKAEALAAAPDPAVHGDAIRELQREWKAVGPVPRAQARTLWNRFRKACNRVLHGTDEAPGEQPRRDDRRPPRRPRTEPPAPRPGAEPAPPAAASSAAPAPEPTTTASSDTSAAVSETSADTELSPPPGVTEGDAPPDTSYS